MNLKRTSLILAILIPVLSTISVCITHVTMAEFHLSQVQHYFIWTAITLKCTLVSPWTGLNTTQAINWISIDSYLCHRYCPIACWT